MISKITKMSKFQQLFLIFLGLPLVVLILLFLHYLNSSIDFKDEYLIEIGLNQTVDVSRDDKGALYINAKTDNDAFFALGFAHAQDRLWQLETQRRIASGTLSEVFGKSMLDTDIWMRTLGLTHAASKAWPALGPEAQASLTAYKNGINAWLDTQPALPPEFQILGIEPKPWTEIDSLAWIKIFSLDLSLNMFKEIENMTAGQVLTKTQAKEILRQYPEQGPTTITKAEFESHQSFDKMMEMKKSLKSKLHLGGKNVGSNAWVISGKLTKDGQPILANDPHLGIKIPSLFYFAHLKGDKLDVSGMTLVGLPLVIFGRNQQITWGGTNMMADTQDLVFEQVNGENSSQYKLNGQWQPFHYRTEYIKVRADFPATLRPAPDPVKIEIRSSHNGPIISDAAGYFGQPMALKWIALQDNDTTYESFFKLNYAHDWNSFKTAMRLHVTPALNMLYADVNNNIGYLSVGRIPIRAKGQGIYPTAGWENQDNWIGYIPTEEWAYSYNPEKGYIVSANNKVIGPDYPYFISHDWAAPTRAERIEQLINATEKEKMTVETMMKMQADTVDISTTQLHKILSAYQPNDDRQAQAVKVLATWQQDMGLDAVGATVFYSWARHLRQHLYADELEGSWQQKSQVGILENFIANTSYNQMATSLAGSGLNWCDDVKTSTKETCNTILSESLNDALDEIEKRIGSDMDDWQWGEIHKTVYQHTPFSQTNLLKQIFEREIANGGGPFSINVSDANFVETEGYIQSQAASFRQIVQMGPQQVKHYYMNSTGQSGHVLSPYYDNMVEPFRNVTFFKGDSTPTTPETEAFVITKK